MTGEAFSVKVADGRVLDRQADVDVAQRLLAPVGTGMWGRLS